jgi:tetratricopeptide (TPR) repeat protein
MFSRQTTTTPLALRTLLATWILLATLPLCAPAMDSGRPRPVSEQEYWVQYERKDWEHAILEAEKLVDAARVNSNAAPVELAEHLSLLGNAQLANKNYIAAQAAFSEALQILEPRLAATSDKLLDPLRGMGYSLAGAGKHDLAVPFMERALIVSRRTHGLFNFNQQGILRQLAASQSKLGDYPDAEQQMQYLLRVGEHTYGAGDARMASVHGLVGDFYMQAGLASVGRDSYREALRVVEKKLGKNDLATVEPLRAYADSYKRELFLSGFGFKSGNERQGVTGDSMQQEPKAFNPRYLNVEGERALKRALKTLDSHPARPPALLVDTLLDLGDWYMIKSQPEEAIPYYRRAVGLLDQVEPERSAVARAKMSFPVQVYYAIPALATRNLNRPDEEVDQRHVHVAFTVGADGAVRDEAVIDQDATSRQISETLAAVRAARYRPKFVNGEPVETKEVSLRQVFRQRKERDTE